MKNQYKKAEWFIKTNKTTSNYMKTVPASLITKVTTN